jgi:hypothetical protein
MNERADPRLIRACNIFATASALFALAVGFSVLAGWRFHIAVLLTWGAATTITPNAAASSVLAGISLWLVRKKENGSLSQGAKLVTKTAAAIVGVVGALTLAEYLLAIDLGIDRMLLSTAPALGLEGAPLRMSPRRRFHFCYVRSSPFPN